jgi:hypothetical protein
MSKTNPDYVLRAQLITQLLMHRYEQGSAFNLQWITSSDSLQLFSAEISEAAHVAERIIQAAKR